MGQLIDRLVTKAYSMRTRLRKLADDEDEDGRWVTMRGRRVFIREGEDPEDAIRNADKKAKTTEPNTVTRDRLKQMFKDGKWEATADATRQGFQEVRNVGTGDRFTVRIRDWTIGGKL